MNRHTRTNKRRGGNRTTALLLVAVAGALAGCKTLEQALDTAERGIAVTRSPTAQTLSGVAKAGNREEVAKLALKNRGEQYKNNPQLLINDIRQAQRDYQNLVNFLSGKVTQTWGAREARLPTRTHYVKYTQNYMSRAIVDFDAGQILIETLDDKDPRASLKNAIVTTLLTPDDPRAVDLFNDNAVTLTSEKEPYLLGLVVDQHGKPVATPAQAEAFADHLLAGVAATRTIALERGKKSALHVEIPLVLNFENKQAEKYRPLVTHYAEQYKISPSLVFAMIRTESNFNPFAVSSAPAFGLMQLVPTSGGREAWRRARGDDGIPTREDLFAPETNIELGVAYLNVLTYNQLEKVGNGVSREYCVISAYNTGPSNTLRAFSRDSVAAVNQINRLEPPAVYEQLRTKLPYEETRQYLEKVVKYRRQFVTPVNAGKP